MKGYKYGKTLVPFAEVDEANLKYEVDSCLKVIGFTSSKNIPREWTVSIIWSSVAMI